jgi:hypothetical protein
LEKRLADFLKADPIFSLKPQRDHVPSSWQMSKENLYLDSDLKQLQYELKAPIEASLSQDFVAGHAGLQIQYFHSTGASGAEALVQKIAETKKPFQKMLIGLSDSLVVVFKSQSEDINKQALSLVRWPTGQEIRAFPVK